MTYFLMLILSFENWNWKPYFKTATTFKMILLLLQFLICVSKSDGHVFCRFSNPCTGTIRCSDDNDACTIDCFDQLSCINLTLQCSSIATCEINCQEAGSCQNVTVIGIKAKHVHFRAKTPLLIDGKTGVSKFESNLYTKVYCPSSNDYSNKFSSGCTIDCGTEAEYLSLPQLNRSFCDNIDIFSQCGGLFINIPNIIVIRLILWIWHTNYKCSIMFKYYCAVKHSDWKYNSTLWTGF